MFTTGRRVPLKCTHMKESEIFEYKKQFGVYFFYNLFLMSLFTEHTKHYQKPN